jgi:hypothetical protein
MDRLSIVLICISQICSAYHENYAGNYERTYSNDALTSLLLALSSAAPTGQPKVHRYSGRSHRIRCQELPDFKTEDLEVKSGKDAWAERYKPKPKGFGKTEPAEEEEESASLDSLETGSRYRECSNKNCNGYGNEMGGLGAMSVPFTDLRPFGWWPIKCYKPCQECMDTGMEYQIIGQDSDEWKGAKAPRDDWKEVSDNVMPQFLADIGKKDKKKGGEDDWSVKLPKFLEDFGKEEK